MSNVIVTGPGKCGGSLIMWIFTELGIDTGFPKGRTYRKTNGDCGGLYEKKFRGTGVKKPLPYVIKEPQMCADIDLRIRALSIDVDHVYIMLRRPGPQAVALEFMKSRANKVDVNDPDWYLLHESLTTRDFDKVTAAIGTRELQVVNLVAELDVPHTLVSYPRFGRDLDYAYSKFRFILEKHNISKEKFKEVWERCVSPDIIDAAYAEMPEWYRATMREAWTFRPRVKRGI